MKLAALYTWPLDAEGRIIPCQREFAVWVVVVGALIDKIGGFGQHIEPVREPGGDPELLLSSRGQRDPVPLSATGRLSPAVDDDVKNGPPDGRANLLTRNFRIILNFSLRATSD